MEFISGDSRYQFSLTFSCLDDYIESDNPVRVIDAFVDMLDIKELGFEKHLPNDTGRPMYNPKDLLKLYIYGYMNRIQSSRSLEKETYRNLEVKWLIGDLKPDHKTIARFRQNNPKALKNVFKAFVQLGIRFNLYGKELVAVDGTKIQASNSRDRNFTKSKLIDRIKRLNSKIDSYLETMDKTDACELAQETINPSETQSIIDTLTKRKEEYMGMLNQLMQGEETQISLTDPDCRLMKTKDGNLVSHNIQAAADSKHHMVAEFFVTSQAQDQNMLSVMERKTAEVFQQDKITFVADMGYNSTSDVAQVVMDGHVPVIAGTSYEFYVPAEQGTGETIMGDYQEEIARPVYLPEKNVFVCQMGQYLKPAAFVVSKHEAKYKNYKACIHCKRKCTDAKYYVASRYIKQSEFSREYDASPIPLRRVRIEENREIAKQRKCIIEHIFGSVKRNLALQYLHVRGSRKVEGEMSLIFLAYNMKRALKVIGVENFLAGIR